MTAASGGAQGLLRGTIQVYLAEMLILPVGLLITAYLTRKLGPEAFGVLSLALTLITWIEWSVSSIFARATFTLVPRAEDWRPLGTTLIRHHLLLSVAMMVAVWIFSIPAARALRAPDLAWVLPVLAIDIPLFSLSQAHRNLLIGLGCFKERAYASAARWIVRLVLVVLLVELEFSMMGAVLASIGASAAEFATARLFVRPSLFAQSSFPPRTLYAFAAPLFVFALVMRLFDKVDLFAVRLLGGTLSQAGAYSAAQNLSLAPGVFALAFAPLLMAALGRRLADGDGNGARVVARESMRATLLLLPFAALVAGAAPAIVVTCFGPSYAAAAPVFAVLVIGAVALVMVSVATAILTVAGKAVLTAILTAPLLPAAVIGHLLLIPRVGPLGASLVTTGLALACAGAAVSAVYRVWGVAPPSATALRAAIVSAGAGALARLWTTPGPELVLALAGGAVAVIIALLLTGEATARERHALRVHSWLARPPAY